MSSAPATALVVSAPERPNFAWIKQKIPIQDVARELGLRVVHNRAQCWRTEDHANGDADPSLRFYSRKNRVRCFVCDLRGGHSNIDLVMGILGCDFPAAVSWICEQFPVPGTKPGRPIGARSASQPQYRVGASGLEIETLIRSGLFGQLAPPEGRILLVLYFFRDLETGLTRMSYRALMRYAGVGSPKSVSLALSHLQKIHALQKNRSPRFGVTRDCSSYRVTLDDEKLLQLCAETFRKTRDEGEQERACRLELRVGRENQACERVFSEHSPAKIEKPNPETETNPTPLSCEGLNLSSLREAQANKSLHLVKREIGSTPVPEDLWAVLKERKPEVLALLRARKSQGCGSENCAGCYSVPGGARIHPPKAAQDYLDWLVKWEAKGRV